MTKKVFIAHVLDYRNAIEWGLNNIRETHDGSKQVRSYLICYSCTVPPNLLLTPCTTQRKPQT